MQPFSLILLGPPVIHPINSSSNLRTFITIFSRTLKTYYKTQTKMAEKIEYGIENNAEIAVVKIEVEEIDQSSKQIKFL